MARKLKLAACLLVILFLFSGIRAQDYNHSYKPVSGFKQSNNDFAPALHLCLLGFSFGKEAAILMELGGGYKGILNFGLTFPF